MSAITPPPSHETPQCWFCKTDKHIHFLSVETKATGEIQHFQLCSRCQKQAFTQQEEYDRLIAMLNAQGGNHPKARIRNPFALSKAAAEESRQRKRELQAWARQRRLQKLNDPILPDRLKAWRKGLRLSKADAARLLATTPTTYAAVEGGMRNPNSELSATLALLFWEPCDGVIY